MPTWKKYKLEEVADIQNGYAFKSKEFSESGIPIIKIKNLTPPYVSLEEAACYNNIINGKLEKYIANKGDILIAMTGSTVNQMSSAVGKISRFQHSIPALINQRVGKFVLSNPELANYNYLYYIITRPEVHYNLALNATGSANQANISPDQIKNINLILPPLPTQHRIAEILGALDYKIDLNLQMNKTLEEMAMALYKHWFVDFGPFRDGEFVDSEIGLIPKGWELKKLSDVIKINKKSINPFDYPDKSFLHYSIPAFDKIAYPKIEFGNEIASNKTLIEQDTILISKLNPKIKRIWTVYNNIDMISFSSTELINYIPILAEDWAYLNCYFRNIEFYDEFLNYTTGTTVSHQRVRPQETLDFQLNYPKEKVRLDFNTIAKSYFDQIESNMIEIEQLKQTRDYLLPKLISGEVEVKEAEKEIKDIA